MLTRSLHLAVLWRQLPFMKYSRCGTPSRSATVLSCSFFGAPEPTRVWTFLKLISQAGLMLLSSSTVFAQLSQYLSTTAIPLPTLNRASFVAGWPQLLQFLGLVLLLQALITENVLFITIQQHTIYNNVGFCRRAFAIEL